MLKLKTPLICAGVSCVLSMFIGMINGVRVLSMVTRGLITGIIVGAFVFCTTVLLKKYIPELFAHQSSPDVSGTSNPETGTNVNITLDDEAANTAEFDVEAPAAALQSSSDDMDETAFPVTETTPEVDEQTAAEIPAAEKTAVIEKTEPLSPQINPAAKPEEADDPLLADLPSAGELIGPDDEESPVIQESADAAVPGADGEFLINQINPITSDTKVMAQAIRTVLTAGD